jgi:heme-degrading monooxygenase HmoA
MFVVHNRIDAPAEMAEAFEKNFAESMRGTLAGVPGLVRSTLMRPAESGQPYVSTMEFDSKESFLDWMKSDSFRSSHSDSQAPGMQARSSIESFTVVEDVQA